jgi:hypothetical protein
MFERVYPTDSNKATFICPKCKKTKTVDISQYVKKTRIVRVNSTCSCGHKWASVLEKRKQYRKEVNLPGTYELVKAGESLDRGGMKVLDISGGGIKMKLNVPRNLEVGDHLNIEFHLDDNKRTLIKKEVTIRNTDGLYVGASFRSADAYDPVLGFYLMS